MEEDNSNIVVFEGKEYNLDELSDEEVLKLHEDIIERGNNIMKELEEEVKNNS